MEFDLHNAEIILTKSASRDAVARLGDADGTLARALLKSGKLIKRPGKDGEIGIVNHRKERKVRLVFTVRRGIIYIVSVDTGGKYE
ncbi:MAG: hypothetical protein AABX01_02600 [Candidatus Micrarchaeota archaeon]